MEIELISRESIKPSAPTPPHHKTHHLAFIDHVVARNYVPAVCFYPKDNASEELPHDNVDDDEYQGTKISMLKKSLSRVLSIYYPFAGRFKDKRSIDCNDEGVTFLVTRIKSNLSHILDNPSEALLNPLFPDEMQWKDLGSSASIVAVQINRFSCGGIAISVCMSHKVGDGSTLFNFVNDWATINRNNPIEEEKGPLLLPSPPSLDAGSSIFPQDDLPIFPEFLFAKQNTVCGRFVFEGSKIESLRAMVSSQNVENPTRVEVVIALIYKRAVSALGLSSDTPLRVAANLRRRMVPPLPDKAIGNWVWSFPVSCRGKQGDEEELHEVVRGTREGLCEFCDKTVKSFGDKKFVIEFLSGATVARRTVVNDSEKRPTLFFFASWCKLPAYVDFGWGKPMWVTSIGSPVKNSVVLMDARDGNGIEALVNMEERDLAIFGRDVELLQYASLNPNIK